MLRNASRVAALALVTAVVAAPSAASADDPTACGAFDVDYALSTTIELRNTQMGAADGTYPAGGGALRLRIDAPKGRAPRAARLVSLDAHLRFEVVARALLWVTRVDTDAHATAVTAHGALRDRVLSWTTPVSGYRSDGTLTCDGSMCGSFGAPPQGTSPLHEGPRDIDFSPFAFSGDMRSFTMSNARISTTGAETYLSMTGREVGRSCVAPE